MKPFQRCDERSLAERSLANTEASKTEDLGSAVDVDAEAGTNADKSNPPNNLAASVVSESGAFDSAVAHPKHYNVGKIEVIDAIEDWGLGFCDGNAVKYIVRAPHKGNRLQDLQKARWYLDRMIDADDSNPVAQSEGTK